MRQCTGCKKELYQLYRESSFGTPIYDDEQLFRVLCYKILQTGLNEKVIANKKREIEKAFDQFNIKKIAQYDESKILELLNNKNMIRPEGKIRAIIHNANQIIRLQNNYQSFSTYLWQFSKNQTLNYDIDAHLLSPLQFATMISNALKKESFKFVGPKTILSFIHEIGIIYAKKVCIYKE